MTKPDKSLIYPLFIPMQGCPARCIYCDQNAISGAGKLDLDTATIEVQAFIRRNKEKSKEVALYGGSFTALERRQRQAIYEAIVPLLDAHSSLRISTHPAFIDSDIIRELQENRVQTVELGVQDFCDTVLAASQRGYTKSRVLESICLLKSAGFKVGVQLMPGLPGSNAKSFEENQALLKSLKPDYLRLYPLIVIKGTALEIRYAAGEYLPLSLPEAIKICADYGELCQSCGIKIIKYGLPTNLESHNIIAGPWHPAFGELVKQELLLREIKSGKSFLDALNKEELNLLKAHGCMFLDEYPLQQSLRKTDI